MKRIVCLIFALAVACAPQHADPHPGSHKVPDVPAAQVLDAIDTAIIIT